jgi:hypothetical protein
MFILWYKTFCPRVLTQTTLRVRCSDVLRGFQAKSLAIAINCYIGVLISGQFPLGSYFVE